MVRLDNKDWILKTWPRAHVAQQRRAENMPREVEDVDRDEVWWSECWTLFLRISVYLRNGEVRVHAHALPRDVRAT